MSSDVFPDDVAPLTMTLQRPVTATSRTAPTASPPNASSGSDAVAEAADGEAGAVGGDRRDHGADPRPVGQAGVDDRRGAVEAPAERGEDAFDDDGEVGRREVAASLEPPVALDPDVAAGVDEDLVDRLVGEQRVERAEAVEPGDGGAHEPLAGGGADERGDAPQVGAHDDVGVAAIALGGPAQLGDELIVGSQRHAVHPCGARPSPSRAAADGRAGGFGCRRTAQLPGQQAGQAGGEQAGVDGTGDGRVVADRGHDRRPGRPLDVGGAQRPPRLGDEHDAVGPARRDGEPSRRAR